MIDTRCPHFVKHIQDVYENPGYPMWATVLATVPPEPWGLRGRGGERPFSDCESARSAASWRERGSEMNPGDFRRSKRDQIQGTP